MKNIHKREDVSYYVVSANKVEFVISKIDFVISLNRYDFVIPKSLFCDIIK